DKTVILKVAHHGSGTHYTHYDYYAPEFYDFIFGNIATENSYAVISCGDSAVYHFPHDNVINALTPECSQILVTKDIGDIVISTDSYHIYINGHEETYVRGTVLSSICGTVAIIVVIMCFYNYNGSRQKKKTKGGK
ncbi:MAG: hypothetical protein LBQ05_03075, partial [Christensenellaceae bacterium]|nr:hypothetical protein [Christensenellaceae bacterium]